MLQRPRFTAGTGIAMLVVAVATTVLVSQLHLALRAGIRHQLDHNLNDDTFYYLQWAWNLAHGMGATFDAVNPTNGVQPLWAAILTALAALANDKNALVSLTLGCAAICNALSVVGLYLVLRSWVSRPVQLASLALWMYLQSNPRLVQNGLEISLNLAVCLFLLHALLSPVRTRVRQWGLGIFAGLAVLTRVDNLLFVLGIGGVLLVQAWRREIHWRAVACFVIPVVLLVVPYAVANQLLFGHPLPISGRVKVYSHWISEVSQHGGYASAGYLVQLPARVFEVIGQLSRLFVPDSAQDLLAHLSWRTEIWFPMIVILTVIAVAGARALAWDRRTRLLTLLVALGGIHVVVLVLLVGRFVAYTTWYFAWQLVLLNVGIGLLMEGGVRAAAARRTRARTLLQAVLIAAAALILVRTSSILASQQRSLQFPHRSSNFLQTRHDVALWIREHLPPDAVLASFNAGQLGYHSDRVVINLDGLMNNTMLLSWHRAQRPLVDYLDVMNVEYVVDWEAGRRDRQTFRHVPKQRLELLREWDVPGDEDPARRFYVYRYQSIPDAAPFTPFLNVEDYP